MLIRFHARDITFFWNRAARTVTNLNGELVAGGCYNMQQARTEAAKFVDNIRRAA